MKGEAGLDGTGVYSVVPTPFDEAGDVDTSSLRRVVDLYVGAGVSGLTTLGVTSEVSRLTEDERGRVTRTVVDQAAGRAPVIVGTSAQSLVGCVEYSRKAAAAGADGLMVCPPRLSKPQPDRIMEHYRGLGEAVDLPIVLQDFPPVQGFSMGADLLVRIANRVSAVTAIKLEDAPTAPKVESIREAAADGGPNVLGGLGGTYLLEELLAGADGTMTGFAFPEVLVEVVDRYRAGEREAASDVFYRYAPLMRFEFQEGIGVALRKSVLQRRGVIENRDVRAPGGSVSEATDRALDNLWTWMAKNREEAWISA